MAKIFLFYTFYILIKMTIYKYTLMWYYFSTNRVSIDFLLTSVDTENFPKFSGMHATSFRIGLK